MAFEVCTAHVFGQFACAILGELAPSSELAALVDDAWRRGNLRAAILLASASAHTWLARGDAAELEHHLQRARKRWQRPRSYGWLDMNLLSAELWHAMYVGDFERGFSRLEADWRALQKSRLMHAPLRRAMLSGLRGSLALGVARMGKANAASMRELARDEAKGMAREHQPLTAAMGLCIEAGLALDRGELTGPLAKLSTALRTFEDAGYVITAHVLRRCIGRVRGDANLVAQVDATLSQLGVVNVDAATRVFGFGVLPERI